MRARILIALVLASSARLSASGEDISAAGEQVFRAAFARASEEEWQTRLAQDEAQALCSQYRNQPPQAVAERIVRAQHKTLRYPEDGKLLGDWKEGEKLASSGRGGHVGRLQPDPAGTKRGGNCYACHALAPKEVAFGTIGPSLTGFGKLRGTSPESIRYTYEKIFNAQAFIACSNMPRFGYHDWLTPKEIADAVAFLLDPQSPVNQ